MTSYLLFFLKNRGSPIPWVCDYPYSAAHYALSHESSTTQTWHGYIGLLLLLLFSKDFIYLFLKRGEEEGEREGKKCQCERETSIGCLSYGPQPPDQGPGLQPSHVPYPGTGLVMLHPAEWHPTNWATPVRATEAFLKQNATKPGHSHTFFLQERVASPVLSPLPDAMVLEEVTPPPDS